MWVRSGIIFSLCTFLPIALIFAQEAEVTGVVQDSTAQGIADVNVEVRGTGDGTTTDASGNFQLFLPAGTYELVFSHVEYQPDSQQISLTSADTLELRVEMKARLRVLEEVEVSGQKDEALRREAGVTTIEPNAAKVVPSAFGDFTRILTTLPGVVSNNELSSTYSVRGGNFDENLVYVNDIPVYRPFLVSAGQQEGLSFINPDLVGAVTFSSGGWQAKYGDKLSSNLNVTYKTPDQTRATATLSLLNGGVHLEGSSKNKRVRYLIGGRYKTAQYLLNTLETDGEYLPRFLDLQSYVSIDLDNDPEDNKTELGILGAIADNRYLVRPESRETTFGTLDQPFRLFVGYVGQEILDYRTYQLGLKLTHRIQDWWTTKLITSRVSTREREYFDLESGYRLCDIDIAPGSQNFNRCVNILGIGSNYAHARNKLEAEIINLENRHAMSLNRRNTLEFGLGYANERIDDVVQQYAFSDSSGYSTIHQSISNALDLNSHRLFAFVQNSTELNEVHTFHYGVRVNYWTVNNQWLISPRMQYSFKPVGLRDVVFRFAAGLYQQPPFYRELRDRQGELNTDVLAQSSMHFIAGADYRFIMFGREFAFLSELYYKHLYNVNPYDVDNVRIRYYAGNNATAYATGADFRISGEFIPGAESWFSLGFLQTKENIEGDGLGDIRRPSDQLVNFGIFFQDHFPNDPSTRVYVSFLYGSGLPFGPPESVRYRNFLDGPDYKRLDLGFSKQLNFRKEKTEENSFFRSLWLGLEMLNVLGAENTISFSWIDDVQGRQYAVPNRLSARFINVKLIARY
ncbi:TonB-dependent receptor [Catalinimonas niigatensis]|uniref:TonB-dependent receptor n=1 Tax=Catalinimonas niigatensis TaxID=1397264 RepID=UPI002665D0CE|nr:carboxypeptidase-like regulatory domain-containing protein [Catalinimonas niigatensis]WPP49563.1 carboxypeptidase-like regulatory domain-containing protein [Catalinimonas niigatensis]